MVLLLGFVTGLALVAPVGPVSLTLFGLGAEQGRRVALAGAGGVVLADLTTVPVALGGAGMLAGIDTGIVRQVEIVLGLALLALAAHLVLRADRARAAVGRVRHPVRTLAAMTICNPLSLVAWSGLALALPASVRGPATLVAFGAGLVLASAVWHAGVAAAGGAMATRMGDRSRDWVTRISGILLFVIGGVLVA